MLLCCGSSFGANSSAKIIYDLPENIALKYHNTISGFGLTEIEMADINEKNFSADTLKLLIILVHWDDRPSTYGQSTFDSLVFSDNVYPLGSVYDYYKEVSYGKLTIVGDVIDWYNAGSYNNNFDFESILPTLNDYIDFSQYDGDNDGNVDAVSFVRSGNGQEESGDFNDIWSYAYVYPLGSGPGPYDGMRIPRWNTIPETRPLREPLAPIMFSGVDTLAQINVMVHELAHNLGLPDLYDYDSKLVLSTFTTPNDDNDHPLYDWDIMGYGGYGIVSLGFPITSHLCGWSKKEMGWNDPIILEGEFTDLVIKDFAVYDDSSLYQVTIDAEAGEYFLLEYRNSISFANFDKYDSDFSVYFWPLLTFGSEPLDRGLLITHIDDSVTQNWDPNRGTPSYPHYTVAVEDAGYNPARDYTTNPEGDVTDSAHWWYPYETRKAATFQNDVEGQEIFGPTTTPNSDGYTGPTGIIVRVDSIVGDRLYAYVYNPISSDFDGDGIPLLADNCTAVYNPAQTDFDLDGIGDSCDTCTDSDGDGFGDAGFPANICAVDNCSDVSNPDQLDTDDDGTGDLCDACTDTDGDGFGDPGFATNSCEVDNCPDIYNPDQLDTDDDGIGDLCDGCCLGIRVNVDGDVNDQADISDLVYLVDYIFVGGIAPVCLEEADLDGVDNSINIDISDLVYMVDFVFTGGAAPNACP